MKSVNLICACTQALAADMMLSGKKITLVKFFLLYGFFLLPNALNFYYLCHP